MSKFCVGPTANGSVGPAPERLSTPEGARKGGQFVVGKPMVALPLAPPMVPKRSSARQRASTTTRTTHDFTQAGDLRFEPYNPLCKNQLQREGRTVCEQMTASNAGVVINFKKQGDDTANRLGQFQRWFNKFLRRSVRRVSRNTIVGTGLIAFEEVAPVSDVGANDRKPAFAQRRYLLPVTGRWLPDFLDTEGSQI
jgi:hypothetical protein